MYGFCFNRFQSSILKSIGKIHQTFKHILIDEQLVTNVSYLAINLSVQLRNKKKLQKQSEFRLDLGRRKNSALESRGWQKAYKWIKNLNSLLPSSTLYLLFS